MAHGIGGSNAFRHRAFATALRSRAESGAAVIEKNKERWRELCERASIEQDPQKMLDLVKEINEVLAEKVARLEDKRGGDVG